MVQFSEGGIQLSAMRRGHDKSRVKQLDYEKTSVMARER